MYYLICFNITVKTKYYDNPCNIFSNFSITINIGKKNEKLYYMLLKILDENYKYCLFIF